MTRSALGLAFRWGAKAGRPLVGALRFILIVLCISFSSAIVSFLVVYQLGSNHTAVRPVDPVLMHRAQTLRTFANELVGLCNEYSRRMPASTRNWSPENRSWAERVFRREVQYLEQRMNDTVLPSVEIYVQLQSTTSRCGGMARHLEDRVLREQTLQEVARTVTAVEDYIEQVTAGAAISPPRIPVRFP